MKPLKVVKFKKPIKKPSFIHYLITSEMKLLLILFLIQNLCAQQPNEKSLIENSVNFNDLIKHEDIFYLQQKDNLYTGSVVVLDSLNKIILEGQMIDGKTTGMWTHYFPSGEIHATFTVRNNELNGDFKQYYPNTTLHKEGSFVDSKMDGIWKLYNKNSQLLFSIQYDIGKVVY